MCGFQDFIEPILDVGATLTGNPELIPLINAGVSTGEGLASGQGFGKALEGGALSGVESLAGQEVAGAVGIGGGNSILNDALGVDISPSATGLPDIGGGIQNALGIGGSGTTPLGGTSGTPTTGGAPDTNTAFLNGTTGTPGGTPAPISGGTAGVTPAPISAGTSAPGGDVTGSFNASDFSSGGTGASGVNSALSSSTIAPSTSGGSFSNGGDFSGGTGGGSAGNGGSFASSAADTNFLQGSPASAPSLNAGQGPTVGNAASAVTPSTESSFSSFIKDPSIGGLGKVLGNNAGILTAGAGLGKDILTANTPLPGEKQLKTQADQLNQLGLQNQSYLNSGTLPPGVQSGITSATKSAVAAIKSKYASMGMSGSSAEQQDIENAQQQAQTQGAEIAMQLLNQGVSETGLSSQIYQELMKNAMANDSNFSSAFTNLASAVGGGSSGGQSITLKTG